MRTILIIALCAIYSCHNGLVKDPAIAANLNHISKISLTNMAGEPIDMSRYKGKVVFINFWATWCKPCIMEMPSIQAAQQKLRNEDIKFLLASDESTEEIAGFSKSHDYTFDYLRVENSGKLNIEALPTTCIYNRNGDLVFSEAGFRSWDNKQNIDMILKILHENK